MKVAVTADIHYGTLTDGEKLSEYITDLNRKGIAYLIIAGDLATRGATHDEFAEALSILQNFSGKVLFVPGNHDIWTRTVDSFTLYKKVIPQLLKEIDFHFLDGNPLVIGDTGFVGSIGWYDYSFREVPREFEKYFSNFLFKFGKNGYIKKWSQIGNDEYMGKVCMVSEDGVKWKKSVWQDKRYIKWDYNDLEFLDYCLLQLRRDIDKLKDSVKEIIVITHHLPFFEFVPDLRDPIWAFNRVYLGSRKIGDLFFQYPKIKLVLFGHSHHNRTIQLGRILGRNIYFPGDGGSEILEI